MLAASICAFSKAVDGVRLLTWSLQNPWATGGRPAFCPYSGIGIWGINRPAMSDEKNAESASQTPSTEGGFISRVGQFLWMKARVDEARAKTFDTSKPGYAWYQVARQFSDDVVVLEDNRREGGAIPLLACNAAGLLIRCHLDRENMPAGPGALTDADWENAQRISAISEALAALTPAQVSTLKGVLGSERDPAVVRIAREDQATLVPAIHRLITRLIAPLDVEANRLRFALLVRRLRVGVTAAVMLLLLGLAGDKIAAKFAKPNLALHRPVSISSQYPGTPPDGAALVDGVRDILAFHTNSGPQQWALIDLGAVTKFDKIVIYNRPDGQHQRAVPLRIEVSNDAKTFSPLRERKETFDSVTFKGLNAQARYVRLLNTPPNYFHLAEVEIY
jgi:hypothetical protein